MSDIRPLNVIAAEINDDWGKPYFGAVPYIQAMGYLVEVTDYYGEDLGRHIVAYFLSNASTWRGPVARRVKAELKSIVR